MGILDALKIRRKERKERNTLALMDRERRKFQTNYDKMRSSEDIRRTSKKSQKLLRRTSATRNRRRSASRKRRRSASRKRRRSVTSKKRKPHVITSTMTSDRLIG